MLLFRITVFLSAFLLFQVQPLMGKFILPWFGGSPSVWTVCLLFFQSFLVAGYAYAHLIERKLSISKQVAMHIGLLALAALLLPVTPDSAWQPDPDSNPTWAIMILLTACVGLPYLVLSATGPLLQAWARNSYPDRSPYPLYALSNLGSLLALASYPFWFEPSFSRQEQGAIWSYGFAFFALLCMASALRSRASTTSERETSPHDVVKAPHRQSFSWLWFGLPAVSSILLLAVTHQITQEIAVFPFLWVLPLALYLLTYILCFNRRPWYSARLFSTALVCCLVYLGVVIHLDLRLKMIHQIGLALVTLFVACMLCHGELVRIKPPPASLTRFYMMLSLGGACGGLFVGLLAPILFNSFVDLYLGIILGCTILLFVGYRTVGGMLQGARNIWLWSTLVFAMGALTLVFLEDIRFNLSDAIIMKRNFYGILSVDERDPEDQESHRYALSHGAVYHGLQYRHPQLRSLPTSYYGAESGIAAAIRYLKKHRSRLRVGVVGMGVGTLTTYGRSSDTFRIYEIDPDIVYLADTYFSYVRDSPADVEVVLGDGRLSLERETPQAYDLLVLDAFSGGTIPVHLLTQDAFAVYLRHVKPDGAIAYNISNRYLNLEPVIWAAADRAGIPTATIDSDADDEGYEMDATWVVVSHNRSLVRYLELQSSYLERDPSAMPIVWTDEKASPFQLMR